MLAAVICASDANAADRPALSNLAEHPQARGGQLVLGPEGKSLYVSGSTRLLTFRRDPVSGAVDLLSDAETGGFTVLSPDGRFAYTAAPQYGPDPARIEILSRDPATGLLTHQYTLPSGNSIAAMVISPDGRDLYALAGDQPTVIRFARQSASGFLARAGEQPLSPNVSKGLALEITSDGRELFVAGLNYGAHLLRDPATGALALSVDDPDQPNAFHWQFDMAVAQDGRRVYVGGGRFAAYARDPATGERTSLVVDRPACERPEWIACMNGIVQPSPDGRSLAMAATDEFRLRLFATTPGGLSQRPRSWVWGDDKLDSLMSMRGVEWSPDSRMLYVLGGALGVWVRDGDDLRFVGEGRLPAPGATDRSPRVQIVGKPAYVPSSRVTLDVARPPGATSLRLSNEPGMVGASARRFEEDRRVSWRLRPSRTGRATVYANYMTRPGANASVRAVQKSSVIVDGSPPRIQRAALRRVASGKRGRTRLLLRARDARSGVSRVQVTTKRSRPGKVRRYARQIVVRGHPRRVWVRVIDRAGNRSRWKRVRAVSDRPVRAVPPSD